MNRLIKWLKPNTRRDSAADVTDDENNAGSSFGWFGNNQADSSIFVTGSRVAGKVESKKPDQTIEPNENSLLDAENDEGFDPYNSGRFNAKSN